MHNIETLKNKVAALKLNGILEIDVNPKGQFHVQFRDGGTFVARNWEIAEGVILGAYLEHKRNEMRIRREGISLARG